MAFYLDDVPPEPFVIEPPETINLTEFDMVEAELVAPDGVVTELVGIIDEALDAIVVTQPSPESVFTVEGIHRLRIVVLSNLNIGQQRIPDVRIVVQDPDSEWHTLDSARAEWPDAEHLADAMLWDLLTVARNDVEAFAPALAVDVPVPVHYRKGQIMQARNLLNAAGVDPTSGDDGAGSFVIRPFPLDWQVKQTLRPKRGIPVVG